MHLIYRSLNDHEWTVVITYHWGRSGTESHVPPDSKSETLDSEDSRNLNFIIAESIGLWLPFLDLLTLENIY